MSKEFSETGRPLNEDNPYYKCLKKIEGLKGDEYNDALRKCKRKYMDHIPIDN